MKECEDHHSWVNNLLIAQWVLLIAALYYTIFTDSIYGMIDLLVASYIVYFMRRSSEKRHYEWHLGQEKEGKHIM
jgi:hypothetical protein